jgi:MerR family transcriptional regulator, copper efflux regulator
LKVIDLKLDEITEKMQKLEKIKSYLTAKRSRITQESGQLKAVATSRSVEN